MGQKQMPCKSLPPGATERKSKKDENEKVSYIPKITRNHNGDTLIIWRSKRWLLKSFLKP